MHVSIRPLEEEDAYTSVVWRNIPEIWKLTGSRPDREITIKDELVWIKKVMTEESSKRFAIIAGDTYVGNIYLTGIDNKSAEYHIFIGDKDYWGKGVAKIASQQIISYSRDILGLATINLGVNEKNEVAIYLYKSLGFVAVGVDDSFIKMRLDLEEKN